MNAALFSVFLGLVTNFDQRCHSAADNYWCWDAADQQLKPTRRGNQVKEESHAYSKS